MSSGPWGVLVTTHAHGKHKGDQTQNSDDADICSAFCSSLGTCFLIDHDAKGRGRLWQCKKCIFYSGTFSTDLHIKTLRPAFKSIIDSTSKTNLRWEKYITMQSRLQEGKQRPQNQGLEKSVAAECVPEELGTCRHPAPWPLILFY